MRYLRRSAAVAVLVLSVAVAVVVMQQPSTGAPKHELMGPPLQPATAALVREISSRNIERSIRKLVSFGTRHTLSSQTDPNRGIGAAADWLFQEFSATRRPRTAA